MKAITAKPRQTLEQIRENKRNVFYHTIDPPKFTFTYDARVTMYNMQYTNINITQNMPPIYLCL